MSDLISRQAAIDAIDSAFPADPMKSKYTQGIACGVALAKTYVGHLPPAQPERKRGHWVGAHTRSASYTFECSECGGIAYFVHGKCRGRNLENRYCGYKYCPNCGADMRGE